MRYISELHNRDGVALGDIGKVYIRLDYLTPLVYSDVMNFNPDLMTPDDRAKALSLIADIQRQSAEILEMLAEMRTLQETPVVIDSEK